MTLEKKLGKVTSPGPRPLLIRGNTAPEEGEGGLSETPLESQSFAEHAHFWKTGAGRYLAAT